ncbi:MAG: hypothetical protein IT458_02435 [Planctomycetes bacterium]|nr:hypothetical protein [Planctomycetota bacterium]
MRTHLLACAALALAVAVPAQSEPFRFTSHPAALDSGYVDHPGATAQVVYRGLASVPGAGWLRLYFDRTNLPAGSSLRLTARHDRAVQVFDAVSLREYADASAYFNGDAVDVELVAGPGTKANRVMVVKLDAGDPAPIPGPSSICGPTDDRTLSSDKRQGRQSPTGCSTWLVSEFVALTAGHCTGTSQQQVHFNVPLSTSGGGLVFPPPEDQYAYDMTTLQRLSGGVGADWSVVCVNRNSNTRMYPGQKQGSWYEIGVVPGSTTGNDIRVTGYGTVSAPVSPTWNQVQKTHVGPLWSIAATSLGYRPDTTGGNSGSPVIHEQTGKAVGIHTHGGCGNSGGTISGQNYGTRIDRADLQAALASRRTLKRPGSFSTVGTGCAGGAGTPSLAGEGWPDLRLTIRLQAANVVANQAGVLLFGASATVWGSTPLPFPLAGIGAPLCSLRVSPDVIVPLGTGAAGTPSFTFTLPNSTALIGVRFHNQYVAGDPGANAAGITVSNGLTAWIGD